MKRLAKFIGYPFTIKEVKACVIKYIIKSCSFENLSNLEVTKVEFIVQWGDPNGVENKL